MERGRKVPVLSTKEKALEQLTQDFIMALSRDSIKLLSGVDMMTAYVRATGHVRSHGPSNLHFFIASLLSVCTLQFRLHPRLSYLSSLNLLLCLFGHLDDK